MTTYEIIKWVESQVNGIGHSDRHFIEHLFGTYDILRSWGEGKGLCHAGLCHSIYETSFFKVDGLRGMITREQLANVIGAESEYLVYLFCHMPNRHNDLKENTFSLPKEYHLPLLKIELANFIEQMHDLDHLPPFDKKAEISRLVNQIKGYDKHFNLKDYDFD